MLKAALFDWDGTLADSRKVIVASFQNALTTINCDINNEFIERLIGVGSAETFRKILHASETSFDESLISALVEEKIHNEINMSADIKLFPGALELLEALHGKVRIGLAKIF
jgi:beta-phosphoglucomutase-like phosphatase (HAD superfamily)